LSSPDQFLRHNPFKVLANESRLKFVEFFGSNKSAAWVATLLHERANRLPQLHLSKLKELDLVSDALRGNTHLLSSIMRHYKNSIRHIYSKTKMVTRQ